MKKSILLFIVICCLAVLIGCAKQVPADDPSEVKQTETARATEAIEPTEVTAGQTAEATACPEPDISGFSIVTDRGSFTGLEPPTAGGYVRIQNALEDAANDPENEGALFEVTIWYGHGEAKLPAEVTERISAEGEAGLNRMNEIAADPVFREFDEGFRDWFANVYFPDCPYKERSPWWGEPGMWQIPENLLTDTLFEPGFDYYQKYFAYLEENGETEKAEQYRPLAEEYWQLGYVSNGHPDYGEFRELYLADCARLLGLGYRLDPGRLAPKYFGVTAYLTREQILDFDNDPDLGYELTFPIDWSYLDP